ncbi:NAD(P)/FAD-dependent oxidoreductase [Rhodothermus marinus]|uniref:FAD-dependent pyridine nucleotide-disulphide oxidoreductase n=1 Tax=Rhodothermus marinus (strain ATCC 43812 / DSM 4252 / R-10) TaxID=518766 RepID=D0MFV9_RHOM4|nr:FAD-dependent oxidoreductase [Rhodothermus marinus]ACY49448.1 FAD-dependent pyridine nucleotide-disulphide oxidoreductase [Rhodothermus marinus DSM 4252]
MKRRILVIGAGPGGIAAARRLRERIGDRLEIVLIEREGTAEFLPGTIATVLGEAPAAHWRTPLRLRGIEVQQGEVQRATGRGVVLTDGRTLEAEAVIAAPGLHLNLTAVPARPNVFAFWSPTTAEAAREAVARLQRGRLVVVISGLPYRCPPAPYSLAMQLAAFYRHHRRDVQLTLTTPEEAPLASLGHGIPEFLLRSCAEAGVEVQLGRRPDWSAGTDRELVFTDGSRLAFDLALVVPPHGRAPMLATLPDEGVLVSVDARLETAEPGLFVVGDATRTSLPRAAGVATAQGRTAADAVLDRLGLARFEGPHLPEPECYIGHGDGRYSRITIHFPEGLPPTGRPEVRLEGPAPELAAGFARVFEEWRTLRTENGR